MSAESRRAQATVILLPGMLGTIEGEWKPHYETIQHYQLNPIGIDWINPIGAQDSHVELTLQYLVDRTLQAIESYELEQSVLWGFDLGGLIGLEIERQYPGTFSGIWVHAFKFFWNDTEVENFRKSLQIDFIPENRQVFLKNTYGEHWKTIVEQNLQLFDDILEYGPTEDSMIDIRIPVLVSVGDQDAFISQREAEQFSDLFSNSEFEIFPGLRHGLHSTRSALIIPSAAEFTRRVRALNH